MIHIHKGFIPVSHKWSLARCSSPMDTTYSALHDRHSTLRHPQHAQLHQGTGGPWSRPTPQSCHTEGRRGHQCRRLLVKHWGKFPAMFDALHTLGHWSAGVWTHSAMNTVWNEKCVRRSWSLDLAKMIAVEWIGPMTLSVHAACAWGQGRRAIWLTDECGIDKESSAIDKPIGSCRNMAS